MAGEIDLTRGSALPDYSKALLDQLTSEYRIIQDKIDKIAGFRFTIRGWSVTLAVAFGFGANTLKLPPYWILSAFLPFLAFLVMEFSQVRNHDILCARAVRIEKRIWRTLRLSCPRESEVIVGGMVRRLEHEVMVGGMVPRLAHELGEDHESLGRTRRWFSSKGYVIFYVAQMVLVFAAAMWIGGIGRLANPTDYPPSKVIKMNSSSPKANSAEGGGGGRTQADPRKP